jgi:hypothetical protein
MIAANSLREGNNGCWDRAHVSINLVGLGYVNTIHPWKRWARDCIVVSVAFWPHSYRRWDAEGIPGEGWDKNKTLLCHESLNNR